jgi:hypothetical protein
MTVVERFSMSLPSALVVALALTSAAHAQDPTAELLKAKPIDGALFLKLIAEATPETKSPFEFKDGRPRSRFVTLLNGRTFVASETVKIYLEGANPFEMSITVSESQAADPNSAQLAKFVDQMLAFPAAIGKKQSADVSPCAPLRALYGHLEKLREALRGGVDNAVHLQAWRTAVNELPGRPGILKAQGLIEARLKALAANRRTAAEELAAIEKLAAGTTTTDLPANEENAALDSPDAAVIELESDSDQSQGTKPAVPPSSGTGVKPPANPTTPANNAGVPQDTATPDPCGGPQALATALARAVEIGDVRLGLKALDSLINDVTAIANAIKPFAADKWEGTAFQVHKLEPDFDQVRTVTVSVAKTTYTATADGITVKVSDAAASAKFVVRRYQVLVPEVAAGFIISGVKVPTWGTELKDGKLLVAAPVRKEHAFAGAVILNAVCRCGVDSSFAFPMAQIGVATDGSAPALLFGGGVRFTRPKRFAIASGLVMPWTKEPGKYAIGDEVPSTAALTDSLELKRQKVTWYFSFQYTF